MEDIIKTLTVISDFCTDGFRQYDHLSRKDLISIINILRSDCDRLRKEVDNLKEVIR